MNDELIHMVTPFNISAWVSSNTPTRKYILPIKCFIGKYRIIFSQLDFYVGGVCAHGSWVWRCGIGFATDAIGRRIAGLLVAIGCF
jgi:hypothetical protein